MLYSLWGGGGAYGAMTYRVRLKAGRLSFIWGNAGSTPAPDLGGR